MSRCPALFIILILAGCSQAPRLMPEQRAATLSVAGTSAYSAGEHHSAVARFTAAADASRSIDDRSGTSRDLHNRGLALLAAGAADAAAKDLDESLRLAAIVDARPGERAATRIALASALVKLGRLDEALVACRSAVDEAIAADHAGLRARALASRAAVQLRRGDRAAAAADLTEAGTHAANDDGAAGIVAVNRGHLLFSSGDTSGADQAYQQATTYFRFAGDMVGLAAALDGAAHVVEVTANGDATRLREAAQRWRRAAAIPAGGQLGASQRLRAAARCLRAAGDTLQADDMEFSAARQ